ncbi:MAG: RHS repeat protein [Betaproteobacteria bacterium]|nr:RHS repeat protein [Betaproteobacteria bacterium]
MNIGSGDKFLVDVDWSSGNTAGLLPLRRYYHSTPDIVSRGSIGSQWRHTYDRSISVLVDTATTFVTALRQNGQTFSFILVNGQWVADADVPDKLTRLTDASGNLSGWQYLNSDDATESYDSAGKLVAIADRFGAVQTLTYDTANRLSVVSDAFGRKMLFTYDSQDRVAQVTDQANGLFRYAYDAADNLSSVTYPDGAVKIYLYPNSAIEFLTARQRGF